MIQLFTQNNLNFFQPHRLIFDVESGHVPEVAEKAEEKERTSPDAAKLAADPEGYFDKHKADITKKIRKLGGTGVDTKRAMQDATDQMDALKREYLDARDRLSIKDLPEKVKEAVNDLKERVQARIKAEKIIRDNPVLKDIYEQLPDEKLLPKIKDIMDAEPNPEIALKNVMAELMRFNYLDMYPSRPAKANELIDYSNSLGRDQMAAIFEYIGVDFNNLSLTTEQIVKMRAVDRALYRFKGMTYVEMGLLDVNGQVQKEGLDKLFNYEKDNIDPANLDQNIALRVSWLRNNFSRKTALYKSLQKYKSGSNGKLPTFTYAGYTFNLNEIVAEQDQELNKFVTLFQTSQPVDKMEADEKATEMPKTLQALFDYRFDENTSLPSSLSGKKLPQPINDRLTALGMIDAKIDNHQRGQIRALIFQYNGKKMRLSIGKYGFNDGDRQPYLRSYYGEFRAAPAKPINLANISQELSKAHKLQTKNDQYAKQVMDNFFPKEKLDTPGWRDVSNMSIIALKEEYLGTISKPQENDLQGVGEDRIQKINKVLPIILANQEALGITDDITIFQALVVIHRHSDAKSLLVKDYTSVIQKLKDPISEYYYGIKPTYRFKPDEVDEDKTIQESRTSKNPDYLARKEKLAKMKIGDVLQVEFRGKSYTFALEDSFQQYEYKFKLNGYPNCDSFKINVLDLVYRSPEEQLQNMMGNSYLRPILDIDDLLEGRKSPTEVGKRIYLDRHFYSGDLLSKQYLNRLPLNDGQKKLLGALNTERDLNISLRTNKYGEIVHLEIRWNNKNNNTNYYLHSNSGEYWDMNSIVAKNSKRNYMLYDAKTTDISDKISQLT